MNPAFSFIKSEVYNDETDIKTFHHMCWILLYCDSGTIEMSFEKRRLMLERSDCFLVSPNTVFSLQGREGSKVIILGFNSESSSAALFSETSNDTNRKIHCCLCNIQGEIKNRFIYNSECTNAYIRIILSVICRNISNKLQNNTDKHLSQLQSIENYISEHYSKKIDFDMLFNSYGYSYSHLRHIFKEKYGLAPKQYLTNIRFENAKRLLTETTLSPKKISQKCGFSSFRYFNTGFLKLFGSSPEEYQNSFNGEVTNGRQ